MQQFITYLRGNILLSIFGFVGVCGLAAAAYFCYDTLTFQRDAKSASGVVVEFKHHTGNAISPVIHFRLPNGNIIEYTSNTSSSTNMFEIGESVQMLYLSNDPQGSSRLDSFVDLWLLPLVFGLFGVIFGGIPVGVWLYDRRSSGASKSMTLQERMDEVKKNNLQNNNIVASTRMSKTMLRIFPVIGIILLLLAGLFAWKHVQFTRTAPQYRAVVIANEMRSRSYYPVYEFLDNRGDTMHAYSTVGTNPPMFEIGETAEIYYNPHDQTADAKGFFTEWFVVLILGFIGTLFTGIGLILLRVFPGATEK